MRDARTEFAARTALEAALAERARRGAGSLRGSDTFAGCGGRVAGAAGAVGEAGERSPGTVETYSRQPNGHVLPALGRRPGPPRVVDSDGKPTLRHAGRLHHIGIGRTHARTPILMLINGRDIRITHATTGEIIRELILDPAVDYQPRGVRKPRKNPP
jgi:hypothetical protein